MEIEVGDWIRSKDGFIGKVRKISYDNMEKSNYYICEKDNIMASNYLENIAKHSKNIIDLVEVGDYVNGYRILEKTKIKNGEMQICILKDNNISNWRTINDKTLKTIVTHEQMQSIEYKVEEDK